MGFNVNFDPVALSNQLFGPGGGGSAGDDARWMNDFAWKQSLRNEQFQTDLAKHGIKMRVDDAVDAGLHPLVGAGVNPAQGGWSGAVFNQPVQKQTPFGASMGANISRSVSATMTLEEKLERAAQLELIRANTAESMARKALAEKEMKMLGATPPMPNKYRTFMNPDGTTETVYSSDYSQAIMSDPLGMWSGSLKKAFGGPDTHPFWGSVKRSAQRLIPGGQ